MIKKGDNVTRISITEIEQTVEKGIEGADQLRAEGLSKLARARRAKLNIQKREHARLNKMYGAKNARVRLLEDRITINRNLIAEASVESENIKARVKKIDKDNWVVYGYVRNKAGKGLANLVVGVYSSECDPKTKLAETCTDKRGYFELCLQPKMFGLEPEAATVKTKEASLTGKPERQFVYLHVSDKDGKRFLHIDHRPLLPRGGGREAREIVLDTEGGADRGQGPDTPGGEKATRYLGNSLTRELHDLKNTKKNCQIDEINADHRVFFNTQKKAIEAGYDFCAYCFKGKSKR